MDKEQRNSNKGFSVTTVIKIVYQPYVGAVLWGPIFAVYFSGEQIQILWLILLCGFLIEFGLGFPASLGREYQKQMVKIEYPHFYHRSGDIALTMTLGLAAYMATRYILSPKSFFNIEEWLAAIIAAALITFALYSAVKLRERL